MAYGQFKDEEGQEYGSFEAFYADQDDCQQYMENWRLEEPRGDDEESPYTPGWYYWACFPGCMPDSDPIGPYESEELAEQAARDGE